MADERPRGGRVAHSNIRAKNGRPCSVCGKPDRAAIEAMARTVSQAEACRRYGIAKGSMSRHMANHTSQTGTACGLLSEPAEAAPPPIIERSETPQGCLIAGFQQAKTMADPVHEPAKATEAAPAPPIFRYAAIGITSGLPMGARCRQCGGARWWRRGFDGYTGCMRCQPIAGRFLPPGVAILST